MTAASAAALRFRQMIETGLRQWVETNPGRVNDRDREGLTPLIAAASIKESLSLVVWLLDEKGADVNGTMADGTSAFHAAGSLDILTALLDRGADPTLAYEENSLPIMWHASFGTEDTVARLLQEPRVRATVNVQDRDSETALHWACKTFGTFGAREAVAPKVHLLLQAGADPLVTNNYGETLLDWVRVHYPTYHAVIALLEQYPDAQKDAEKATLLVKARRHVVATNSNIVAPSCLQGRVARGQPLPCVALTPLTDEQTEVEDEDEEGEEGRKLRTTLAFTCGFGREAMPRDVFLVVMDLLMPSWDPLRRKNTGTGPPAEQS